MCHWVNQWTLDGDLNFSFSVRRKKSLFFELKNDNPEPTYKKACVTSSVSIQQDFSPGIPIQYMTTIIVTYSRPVKTGHLKATPTQVLRSFTEMIARLLKLGLARWDKSKTYRD